MHSSLCLRHIFDIFELRNDSSLRKLLRSLVPGFVLNIFHNKLRSQAGKQFSLRLTLLK